MKNFNYLMDPILFQTFMINLNSLSKKYKTVANDPLIQIYVKQIEKRVNFKIRSGYYLLLSSETMKLILNFYPQRRWNFLEANNLVLVYYKLFKNTCQHESRVLRNLLPNKSF